ncbi:hypothetical protein [Falsiroseomonas selenitidurans]|uniref:Uncharacterized protein n=1 Tax=Falsiroseomonas selenitidurans TaxID=2716335 RepID=A0ABX1DWZ9_9PROT|nr:hypothetical protein [Falsiroseomonas selenitidurans]NKC29421.1 hypothetical protein [Falsiroseomonas selenitidurans]
MIPEIPPQLMAALADAPLAALMLWMMHMLRRELQARPEARPEAPPAAPAPAPTRPARDELVDFKLEVARTYVPLSLIRDLDSRLSLQLLRIEEKLDEVSRAATTASAIAGHPVANRTMGFSPRADAEAGR